MALIGSACEGSALMLNQAQLATASLAVLIISDDPETPAGLQTLALCWLRLQLFQPSEATSGS